MNFSFNFTVTQEELKEGRFFVALLPNNDKIYARKMSTLQVLVYQHMADIFRDLNKPEISE